MVGVGVILITLAGGALIFRMGLASLRIERKKQEAAKALLNIEGNVTSPLNRDSVEAPSLKDQSFYNESRNNRANEIVNPASGA